MSTVYDEKLLDKVGMAMVPSGYTNNAADEGNTGGALGKVYSVLPVQTIGDNIVTNGTFDADANWSKGTGWDINGGKAVCDGTQTNVTNLSSNTGETTLAGGTYRITYTVTRTNGTIRVNLGNWGEYRSSDGTYTDIIQDTNGGSRIVIQGNADFVGSVDNVSVQLISDGDFDFSRGSDATRVNSQGYIESVQVLSGDLLTNGDFEEIGSELISNGDFEQIGSEEVTNGTFDTDSGWVRQEGWTIADGVATFDYTTIVGTSNRNLYQGALTTNKVYKLTFDITSYTSGFIRNVNNSVTDDETFSGVGSYTQYFKAASVQLYLKASNDAILSIDNVSVKELGQNWNFGVASLSSFVADGELILGPGVSNNRVNQPGVMTVGNNYQLTVDITEIAAGDSLEYLKGGSWRLVGDSVGTHTVAFKTTESAIYLRNNNGTQRIKFDNVSLKELVSNITADPGWTFPNGQAYYDGVSVNQDFQFDDFNPAINGKYEITFEVVSDDNMNLFFGSGANAIVDWTLYSKGVHTVQGISPSNSQFKVYATNIDGGNAGTIDNISVKRVTDDTDIPRLDYTNSACPSLLLEPQRSNYVTDTPSSFVNADWGDDVLSPEGKVNGKSFVPDTTPNTTHYVSISSDSSINIASNSVTFSFYAKEGSSSIIRGRFDESSFTERLYFAVDISDGTFLFSGGASSTAIGNIEESINGWKRVSMTVTYTSAPTGSYIICYIGSGDNFATDIDSYTGDGSAFIYFYGFQMENGSYPTSYIPTNGLLVTRRADVCNNAGDSTIFNDDEGVLFVDMASIANDSTAKGFSISDGSISNRVSFMHWTTDNRIETRVASGGNNYFSTNYVVQNITDFNKVAIKYKANDFALWVNGEEVLTDNSGLSPVGLKTIQFDTGIGTANFYGKTRSLLYFNEALSDAELEYITSADIDLTIHNYKGSLSKISATYEDVGVKDRLTKLF